MQPRNVLLHKPLLGYSVSPSGVITPYEDSRTWFKDVMTNAIDKKNGDFKNPNDFEMASNRIFCLTGTYATGSTSTPEAFFAEGALGPEPDVIPEFADFDPKALEQCYDKLIERTRASIDLSIDIAQRNQAVAMVAKAYNIVSYVRKQPLKALKKSYEYFRTRGSKGVGKDIGGLWLEYTYGLSPLAGTLYDTAVHLGRNIEPSMKVDVKSTSKRKATKVDSNNPNLPGTWTSTHESSTRCRYVLRLKMGTEADQLIGNFTSLNPVSFAWENLPFSFVADWFYDIGGHLRNLETSIVYGNTFLGGYRTITMKYKSKTEVKLDETSGTSYRRILCTGEREAMQKRRLVLPGYPSPYTPRFQCDLGSGRMLNAAALLSQFLKG